MVDSITDIDVDLKDVFVNFKNNCLEDGYLLFYNLVQDM